MAVPPPPPEVQPGAGLPIASLAEVNLTQWASCVQDVTSGMRKPPQAASECPQQDIVGVLDWLESMTPLKYCRHCFRIGDQCRCRSTSPQAQSLGTALWMPPTMSYASMASMTVTTASSAVAVVPPTARSQGPPPGINVSLPNLSDLVGMVASLSPESTSSLLVGAGRGRGVRPPADGQTPVAPGLRQV